MSIASEITRIENNISSAYTALDGKGATLPQIQNSANLANTIESIPTGGGGGDVVENPALRLIDWEGTTLKDYSKTDALALEALPAPSTLSAYAGVDHELLLFQEWNWSLADIKTWLTNHTHGNLNVGAIYTTTDGQNHNYWASPRGEGAALINMQKRATASIGTSSFYACPVLTNINFPDGVTIIGDSAFLYDRSLEFVNIPDGVRSIGAQSFGACNNLFFITIPNSVTSIGNGAFEDCRSLKSIIIPDSVTNIGDSTFKTCYFLKYVIISENVTAVAPSAFRTCCSLPHIRIPANATSIGANAFESCKSLFDILLEGKPSLASTNALSNTPATQKIYVPRANLSWFETATNWATYYSRFVAIEDNIAYLESLGYNVDAYK